MTKDAIRLLSDVRYFLNWNVCERAFIINMLLTGLMIPMIATVYLLYPQVLVFPLALGLLLLAIISLNLYEIHRGYQQGFTIYLQILYITGMIGFGCSYLGSVNSGIGCVAIFLMICYYLLMGIRYSTLLGALCFLTIISIITLDFILEVLPYAWFWDSLQFSHSGNEIRALLATTRPGKAAVEFIFISCLPLTIFILRSFDRQLRLKTQAIRQAHQMMESAKELSDHLLRQSQQTQEELQEGINLLMEAVEKIGEGDLNVPIPNLGDHPMSQLAQGFERMVGELKIVKQADELTRRKEAQQSQELRECINELLSVVEEVGKGNLEVIPPDFGNKALGKLSRGLAEMIIKQHVSRVEEVRHQLAMSRTNALVENAPNSLMMIDGRGMVRYLNPAARQMFELLREAIQVPPEKIMDNPCERILPEPELRQLLLDPLKLPYRNEFSMGREWVYLEATAVYDHNRNFLGPMLAWKIITEEKERSERHRHLQEQVKMLSQKLGKASYELLGVSEQMAEASSQTSLQTQKVVGEVKEIQSSIQHIATALEQMSATLHINESLVAQSTQMSEKAVQTSQEASEIISTLGQSSISIGGIVQLINRITQQTNILALNATIQATRAGESGRGFGVVAREVKALAQQTSEATTQIAAQIKGIQSDSRQAVDAIQQVHDIIGQMSEVAGQIYTAIGQQTATTQEIAQRMEEASGASKGVTMHILRVSEVAHANMHGVQRGREAILSVDHIVAHLNNLVTAIR